MSFKDLKLIRLLLCVVSILFSVPTHADKVLNSNKVSFETKYYFDIDGKLIKLRKPDGKIIRYYYNERGLLWRIESDNEVIVEYEYDPMGNVVSVKSKRGETYYSYDTFNRIKTVKFNYGSPKTIEYDYDPWGRVSRIIVKSEDNIPEYCLEYRYDVLGRVVAIEARQGSNQPVKIIYKYDPGRLEIIRKLPNGISTIFRYYNDGHLRSVMHRDRDNKLLAYFEYHYKPNGLIHIVKENIKGKQVTIKYNYDKAGRLIKVEYSGGRKYQYSYDSKENKVIVQSSQGTFEKKYDWAGRLTKWRDNTFKYDLNGNMIKWKNRFETVQFKYDTLNRLVSIQKKNDNLTYRYTAEGLLNKSIYKGTSQRFSTMYIPDPRFPDWRPLASYRSDGVKTFNIWMDNQLLGTMTKGKVSFNLEDGFLRARMETDISGNIVKINKPFSLKAPKISTFHSGKMLFDIPKTFNKDILPRFNMSNSFNLISYQLQDYVDHIYNGVRELIELGQRLPLQPQHVIEAYNKYWQSGAYKYHDPYYREVIAPLSSSLGIPEREKYTDTLEYVRESLRTWIPGYDLGEDLYRIGVASWTRIYGGLIEKAFRQMDEAFSKAGIRVTPTPSIDDYVRDLDIVPSGQDLIKDLVSLCVPKVLKLTSDIYGKKIIKPIQRALAIFGKWEWIKHTLNLTDFDAVQPKGVKFDKPAEFIGHIGDITGFSFDRKTGKFYLVGDPSIEMPPIRLDDLAMAIRIVYGEQPNSPTFSLDPRNPDAPPKEQFLEPVYRPQILKGSHMGYVMFKADWLLKQYTFGVIADEQGNIIDERVSSVPGYKSYLELASNSPPQSGTVWSRFWIVPCEMKLARSGNVLTFVKATMQVKTKRMEIINGQLVDSEYLKDEIANNFALFFTENYDKFARESPIFEEVRQLAKVVAIIKWLKKNGIGADNFDLDWVEEYANKKSSRYSPKGDIRALDREAASNWGMGWIRLTGGVELNPIPIDVPATDNRFEQAIAFSPLECSNSAITEVKVGHKLYRVTVLPVTKWGHKFWNNHPVVVKNGLTYTGDKDGRVRMVLDKYGNSLTYDYNREGKVTKIVLSSRTGWRMVASQDSRGKHVTVYTPTRHLLKYYFNDNGLLQEIYVDNKPFAKFTYSTNEIEVAYYKRVYKKKFKLQGFKYIPIKEEKDVVTFREKLMFSYDGHLIKYTQIDEKNKRRESISFKYPTRNSVIISGENIGKLTITRSDDGIIFIKMPNGSQWKWNKNGFIEEISFTKGERIKFYRKKGRLKRILLQKGGRQEEIFYDDKVIKINNFLGRVIEFHYSNGLLHVIKDSIGRIIQYDYDNKGRIKSINLHGKCYLRFARDVYFDKNSNEWRESLSVKVEGNTKASSSIEDRKSILQGRLKDDIQASKKLENALIIDLFVDGEDFVSLNIASKGAFKKLSYEVAREFRHLLKNTANAMGPIGKQYLKRWEKFYNFYLSPLAKKPLYWKTPDGRSVKLKPILIIKSNEASYKYANLGKIPVLMDNFIVFIAEKTTRTEELVAKINNVPKLSRGNIVFIVRLPKMERKLEQKWKKAITELKEVVGKENVVFNPSKEEFKGLLRNRQKNLILIELVHTDRGIVLRNNERFNSEDILQESKLSHIKYFLSGLCTCNLPLLEKGKFVSSLRKKGVGIINASCKEISSEIGLMRLKRLIYILKNIDFYNIPAYYLPDIIDQLEGIREKGTINLGKLEYNNTICLWKRHIIIK